MKTKETLASGESPLDSTVLRQVPREQEKSITEADCAKAIPFYNCTLKVVFLNVLLGISLKQN